MDILETVGVLIPRTEIRAYRVVLQSVQRERGAAHSVYELAIKYQTSRKLILFYFPPYFIS